MSTNNITDLETLILNTIDDLKDNPNCNIPQARAISSLAEIIFACSRMSFINSVILVSCF